MERADSSSVPGAVPLRRLACIAPRNAFNGCQLSSCSRAFPLFLYGRHLRNNGATGGCCVPAFLCIVHVLAAPMTIVRSRCRSRRAAFAVQDRTIIARNRCHAHCHFTVSAAMTIVASRLRSSLRAIPRQVQLADRQNRSVGQAQIVMHVRWEILDLEFNLS